MSNPISKAIANWRMRHLNPVSFWLHMVGIPACFVAAPLMLILGLWWWALGLFVVGYVLQFIGHGIEGNQSGEEMLVRRILKRPAPGTEKDNDNENPGSS